MLRTVVDYHTPIIEIWQKPRLQIKWYYTRQDYTIVRNYLTDHLHIEWADYLRYHSGLWYGITTIPEVSAWLECPERYSIPFKDFLTLVDFKIRSFHTVDGLIPNKYNTVIISSRYTLYEIYPDINKTNLNKICQFMEVNRLEM